VGQWYVFDLLGIWPSTSHNVNSMLIAECPQITARIKQRGDEFIGHGRTNAGAILSEEEKQLIDEATDTLKRYTGHQPDGWMGLPRAVGSNARSVERRVNTCSIGRRTISLLDADALWTAPVSALFARAE
jgi:hypothetical protein